MKYALITAPDGFRVVRELGLSYHLVLAQYCGDINYVAFYRERHYRGDFIMMDNGAAELGSSIGFDTVLYRAGIVGADEIILPDVLDDYEATIEASRKWAWKVPHKQRAVVPQGKTWEEWSRCMKDLIDLGCSTICIAKRYERLPGGRVEALKILAELGLLDKYNIHLLGFNSDPEGEVQRAVDFYPDIRGCDSAAPMAYAQHDSFLTSEHIGYEWGAPANVDKAIYNAQRLMFLCNQVEEV